MLRHLAVSWPVFSALRQHPKIIDRFKYTQVGVLDPEALKTAFEDPTEAMTVTAIRLGGKPIGSLVSQQNEKFLFQQSRKFLFETGKLAG